MRARDLMTGPVITIHRDATIQEAARLMLEHEVSCLPVVDDKGDIVGMLTHSDFELHPKFLPLGGELFKLLGSWVDPDSAEDIYHKVGDQRVRDIMNTPVTTVDPEEPVSRIADLMLRRKVRRLPVVHKGQLIGIITRHDLLKLIMDQGHLV